MGDQSRATSPRSVPPPMPPPPRARCERLLRVCSAAGTAAKVGAAGGVRELGVTVSTPSGFVKSLRSVASSPATQITPCPGGWAGSSGVKGQRAKSYSGSRTTKAARCSASQSMSKAATTIPTLSGAGSTERDLFMCVTGRRLQGSGRRRCALGRLGGEGNGSGATPDPERLCRVDQLTRQQKCVRVREGAPETLPWLDFIMQRRPARTGGRVSYPRPNIPAPRDPRKECGYNRIRARTAGR